jgi:hypothetical protein
LRQTSHIGVLALYRYVRSPVREGAKTGGHVPLTVKKTASEKPAVEFSRRMAGPQWRGASPRCAAIPLAVCDPGGGFRAAIRPVLARLTFSILLFSEPKRINALPTPRRRPADAADFT